MASDGDAFRKPTYDSTTVYHADEDCTPAPKQENRVPVDPDGTEGLADLLESFAENAWRGEDRVHP